MVSRNYKTLQRLPALRYTPCDSFYRPFNNYITRKRILNEHYFIVAFMLICFVDRDSFSECSRRWRLVSPRRVQASPAHVPKCSAACANCGKETFPIHSNPQSWMNRMRKRRQHPRPNAEGRRNFNSTRNGNREPRWFRLAGGIPSCHLCAFFELYGRFSAVGVRAECSEGLPAPFFPSESASAPQLLVDQS